MVVIGAIGLMIKSTVITIEIQDTTEITEKEAVHPTLSILQVLIHREEVRKEDIEGREVDLHKVHNQVTVEMIEVVPLKLD